MRMPSAVRPRASLPRVAGADDSKPPWLPIPSCRPLRREHPLPLANWTVGPNKMVVLPAKDLRQV
ncbi:vegetative cell wall protein gp1-like [Iris pallida]|uniref:Vegetative cell wall protein gp1-like n=1 Tax=Iris pallida TaxID=29817 RepID=A0AAX6DQD5_IRIPA|nr:vegetative cell wall protein gp1-like [Iris pallida]KAJ6794001.1 vegetative cell wall protein gp1-like [Iris pallida]